MALIGKQKYSPEKMDKLQEYVKIYSEKGKPVEYEILVDGFKAVRRTNDPDMFVMYESFIHPESKYIEVLFYTGASNNNDKHIFTLQDEPKDTGLSGIEVENRIQARIEEHKRNWEHEQIIQENKTLKKELAEADAEIEQLEKELEEHKSSQSPLKGMLGELGATMVESFIKRNPEILAKLPGGNALAGFVDGGNSATNEGEVSFAPKGTGHGLSAEDQQAITFVRDLRQKFSRQEMEQLLEVIHLLAEDKGRIIETLEYLKTEEDEQVHV